MSQHCKCFLASAYTLPTGTLHVNCLPQRYFSRVKKKIFLFTVVLYFSYPHTHTHTHTQAARSGLDRCQSQANSASSEQDKAEAAIGVELHEALVKALE